jgi:hypothetical protein
MSTTATCSVRSGHGGGEPWRLSGAIRIASYFVRLVTIMNAIASTQRIIKCASFIVDDDTQKSFLFLSAITNLLLIPLLEAN